MDKVQEILIKMLKKNDFFKNLTDEQLLKFADLFKLGMAVQNQAIIIEGQVPQKIYILKRGKLIAKKAHGLNSIILGEIKEGEVFGEMSFFYKKPAMASVVCESSTADYWEIERGDFDSFLQENSEIKEKISEVLRKREQINKEKSILTSDINKSNDDDLDIEIRL